MSTITVTNIKATGETASRSVSGVAAAWCNVNGTGTIAIRDSQNVSSVTDTGTGDVTYSFSNAMANTNYVQTCSAGFVNDDGMSRYSEATGSWRTYYFLLSSRDAKDGSVNSSAIFGDLS
jgi:hypothetical protein